MIVLGLGSSLGDRLDNLRRALNAIKKIPELTVLQVSPVYMSDAMLPENASETWHVPYLNFALRCESHLSPDKLLTQLKSIEKNLGRQVAEKWAPRIIDIDILAWDNKIIQTNALTLPHKGLLDRPFALWPLADVAPYWPFPENGEQQGKTAAELITHWGSRFSGHAPFHTKQINQRVDTPRLMGVINITPDSFSDGGKYIAVENALEQARHLINVGADIIDIGAESTAPNSTTISAEDEWARLEPVLKAINQEKRSFLLPPKISVDTRRASVAEKALAYDIDWLNDVTGFRDPAMVALAVASGKDCLVMHHVSLPAHKELLPSDVNAVSFIHDWAKQHLFDLENKGIARDKIIFDPGIGFGKAAHQSLALIKNIDTFSDLGCRILVGHSRKSFLSTFTDLPFAQRDTETLACSLYLSQQPVDYLRVHDVEMCARGLKVWKALSVTLSC